MPKVYAYIKCATDRNETEKQKIGHEARAERNTADPDLRLGGGANHAGAKPRVPTNTVFSSDLDHLFFVTALTR